MKKTKKGFTLVELVIVVAVMAVLVAVAIPTVSAITGTARENVKKTNAQTIESMIKLEEAELSETGTPLTDALIKTALEQAKLGITTGDFSYDTSTGNVEVGSATETGDIDIKFATTNNVTTITVTTKAAAQQNP